MSLTVTPSQSILTTSGQDTNLFPAMSEWTIAQAAEFLDMPEDCLNQMLDVGVLEFRQDHDKRLLQQSIVQKYDQRRKRVEKGLIEIMRLSEEMRLYDDD